MNQACLWNKRFMTAKSKGGVITNAPVESDQPRMDDAEFQRWSTLLENRTGMHLPENRLSFLVSNLNRRMRELGINRYQDYYDQLQSGHNAKLEWDQLVDRLTVHETRFIRHPPSLELMRREALPQTPRQGQIKPLTFNVWSVGCSTGEEPYSIAMCIDQHLTGLGYDYYLGIIASDISRNALARGREGRYSFEQIKHLDPVWINTYFQKDADGKYQVVNEIRQRVCFNHLNILDMGKTPIGNMDVVICQNVLIYYQRERRLQIVNSLVDRLAPGGLLITGVGEMVNWQHPDLERVPFANTLAFRRLRQGTRISAT